MSVSPGLPRTMGSGSKKPKDWEKLAASISPSFPSLLVILSQCLSFCKDNPMAPPTAEFSYWFLPSYTTYLHCQALNHHWQRVEIEVFSDLIAVITILWLPKLHHRQYSLNFANVKMCSYHFKSGMRPDCNYSVSKTEDRIAAHLYKITLIQLFKTQSKRKQKMLTPVCGRNGQLTSAGMESALNEDYYKVREVVTNCGRSKDVSPLNVKDLLWIVWKPVCSKQVTFAFYRRPIIT